MSITETIKELTEKGVLTFLEPGLPGVSVSRDIFVSKEVYDLVGDDASPTSQLLRVAGKARAKLDFITGGGMFVFALDPSNKSVTSLIARNHKVSQGVLDVRINDPKPEIRIFGCCADCDVLVLLTWALRKNLKFNKEVARCQTEWNSLFSGIPPVISNRHEHYFSEHIIPG